MHIKFYKFKQTFPVFTIYLLNSFLLFSCNSTASLETSSDDQAPLDPSIRQGQLSNGLRYFIKPMSEPQEKVYMRFYSKAGNNQADEDQYNIPHGVEHLAFKASKGFPEGVHNSSLSELGVGIYDMMAFSGSRTTNYYFDAPPGNWQAIEAGIKFFRNVAVGLKLTEDDIKEVRGELRQEIVEKTVDLDKKAAIEKLESKIFPCQAVYEDFLEHHENFDSEVIRRFYKEWYRPDLMAITVVGNIEEVDRLEQIIRKNFSDIKPSEDPRKWKNCDSLYYSRPQQFYTVSRPSKPSQYLPDDVVDLRMYYRDPESLNKIGTLEGVKRYTALKLLMSIANERLQELRYGYNSFKVQTRDDFAHGKELPIALQIRAQLRKIDFRSAVRKIAETLAQLQRFGATGAEWKMLKEKQMQIMKSQHTENAGYWIEQIRDYYTFGEALPANKMEELQKWLSGYTLTEFNQFINGFLSHGPEDIGIIAPEGHPALSLKEAEVRSWVEKEFKKELEPFSRPITLKNLMDEERVSRLKRKVVKGIKLRKSGAIEYILNNGLKLVLDTVKPTPGSYQDKIMIHGFTQKGFSCFPKENHFSIINAPRIVAHSGVDGMDKFDIDRFLQRKEIKPVSIYVDYDDAGIQASVTPENLKDVLQLIYLSFTKPRKDELAFKDWKYNAYQNRNLVHPDLITSIRKISGDPSILTWSDYIGVKSKLSGTDFLEGVEKTDLDKAYAFYKNIFNNAQDFTFVVTGDYEIEAVLPLFTKYLGNLPRSNSSLSCSIEKDPLPRERIKEGLYKIPAPGGEELHTNMYSMKFITATEGIPQWQELITIEALGVVFRKLLWSLRFDKGYSLYSVVAGGDFNEVKQRFEVTAYLDCVPQEFPQIRRDALEISEKMKTSLVDEKQLRTWMQRIYSKYEAEGGGGRHRTHHEKLYRHYRYQIPISEPKDVEEFIKALAPEDIREAANKYLQEENLYEFVMEANEVQ